MRPPGAVDREFVYIDLGDFPQTQQQHHHQQQQQQNTSKTMTTHTYEDAHTRDEKKTQGKIT